jgi:hypothetical protein
MHAGPGSRLAIEKHGALGGPAKEPALASLSSSAAFSKKA